MTKIKYYIIIILKNTLRKTFHVTQSLKIYSIITGFYIDFTIRGTFHYEPNSGKITSTGNTSITDIGYTDKPMGFNARIEYITYDAPRIIDNGYTALFGATIKVCGYSESSPVIIAEDYAPVHATVRGQAD